MIPLPTTDDCIASDPCLVFERRLVTTSVEGSVAILRICRKKARQTLNPATTFQLRQAIEEAESNPEIKGIVLTGSGSFFASGADTSYFLTAIEQGEILRLREFTKVSNECFDAIERCSKPVVAALNGSALGGGLELALACHSRVVTLAASLAFPETGLGLVPGCGGPSRASKLLGKGLAKWLVYCGPFLTAREALLIGLVDQLAPPQDLLKTAKRMALEGSVVSPVPENKSELPHRETIARLFSNYSLEQICNENADLFPSNEMANLRETLATKGPLALKLAEQQFSLLEQLPLESLLEANLDIIVQCFQSRDAHLGLVALQQGKKEPVLFEGRLSSSRLGPSRHNTGVT